MPSPRDDSLPERIGKYRVLRKLGEGATSEVFLARDDFRGQEVAIKRVRAHALPAGAGRSAAPSRGRGNSRFFAAEAALVGRLQHPNVVQILDAVPDAAGPFLVMEHVPGITLRRFCRADALLALEQVVEIGFKLAMALGYVYRQGLIHRDVKPANILAVVEREQVVDVKITDFGSVLNLRSDHTQVFRVGSLAYMAPEQLDGADIDCRADIYGLAAVLYHLVAGRPPFDAATQQALMHQIYTVEPPSLQGLREGVPASLDALIRQALAKRPQDRPASWDAFAQGLSALVANREVARGRLQGVLDSERFNLLRSLDFFSGFGDVELWEVVHRAKWQRFKPGHAIYTRGEEGNDFHILAQGEVEVVRDGKKVATLGAGTSVGEMAYLAPNADLRRHSTDVTVTQPCTSISFTPQTLEALSPATRHLFDGAFIRVLVRRLHAAHEALAHPRRIL
ncbi:serine/threonine-protein kinase [Aquabacterium sp. J223]|uniref:serine/threonine-protein kinase n=1 Tax=Aquabacterium sp. J223 TaxID=2898431 RepID=UPI0021ADC4C3|nr:serine/threonine-protein kinase [Aquabacterium sp. J223]UUX95868.1 serine/threonine-protein kinase [Aquabacterium sp. J223]